LDPIPFYNAASDDFRQLRIFRGSNQAGMIVDDLSVLPIPEPASLTMVVCGMGLLAVRRMRRKCAEQPTV
jgi:hypothetical protein